VHWRPEADPDAADGSATNGSATNGTPANGRRNGVSDARPAATVPTAEPHASAEAEIVMEEAPKSKRRWRIFGRAR